MKKVCFIPLVALLSACGQAPTPSTTFSLQIQTEYSDCFAVIPAVNDSGLFEVKGTVFELDQSQQEICVAELMEKKFQAEDLALRQALYSELEGEEPNQVIARATRGELEAGQRFQLKHIAQLNDSFKPKSEAFKHAERQIAAMEFQVVHQVVDETEPAHNMWVVVPDVRSAVSLHIITETEQEIGTQWRDLAKNDRWYVYQSSNLEPHESGQYSGYHTFKVTEKGR
ncbi:hypothetical protein [Vibrio sp. WXL103]|uniref:hypothetical protein n=1 Tax=Vibrio sp. WXL103 TaxID=3450710 RepID=UPI003EC4E1F9